MTTNVGGYWVYTPTGASANSACIIAMHGSGEQGDGSSTDLNKLTTQGFAKLINDTMGTGGEFPYDCICIFPQYTGGTPSLFRMQGIINYVKSNFTFDQNKLHLTGYSLGAAGVTGWWEIGDLTDIASCSIVATPSTYYSAGAANAVADNMPTLFLHGTLDAHPTAYAYSVGWVNGLNTDGINPAAVLVSLTGEGHNIDEAVYDWRWYQPVTGKTLMQWHFDYSRAASGSSSGSAAGTASVSGSLSSSSSSASGTIPGTSSVSATAKVITTVSGSASGIATTEGQKTYIDVGGPSQNLNGQSWIGLTSGQVTGGVFTDVTIIWGESFNEPILNTGSYPQQIYKSARLGSSGFTINYPFANGTYTLRLHFCEFWRNTAGRNVFNVSVEGTQVITGLDVWTVAGGRYRAYYQDVPVTISDGSLTIQCTPTAGDAMLNGFEIIAPGANARLLTGMSGTAAGSSSVTGDALTFGATVEVINATSAVTGSAVIISIAAGQSAGAASLAASASITTKSSGSTEGSSTATGSAKVIAIASGATSGQASLSVTESGITLMSGTTAGSSSLAGAAKVLFMITGASSGSSTAFAGTLTIAGQIRPGAARTSINKSGPVRTTLNYKTNIA